MPVKSKDQARFFRAVLARPGDTRLKQVAKEFLSKTKSYKGLPDKVKPAKVTRKRGRPKKGIL